MFSKLDYENTLIRLECCRDNLNLLVSACETIDPYLSNAIHCVEYELIEIHQEFLAYLLEQEDQFKA